jgi:3'-5' exoribonuclease
MTEQERIDKVANAMAYLHDTAVAYLQSPYSDLCLTAIQQYDQGYGGSKHHHNYIGGLAVHVADVVRRCLDLSGTDRAPQLYPTANVDLTVLLTSAYWHDYGELAEYAWKETPGPFSELFGSKSDGYVATTPYAKLCGHVVGSAYEFLEVVRGADLAEADHQATVDAIVHCMLAHHGRKEWGSPVEPATNEAWILHAADMMSSREGALNGL